jgi:hypothetical protein
MLQKWYYLFIIYCKVHSILPYIFAVYPIYFTICKSIKINFYTNIEIKAL